jgi:hypothetical protein
MIPIPSSPGKCFVVRDADGHALAYVYFDKPGWTAAHDLKRDEARRIAVNIAAARLGWSGGSPDHP